MFVAVLSYSTVLFFFVLTAVLQVPLLRSDLRRASTEESEAHTEEKPKMGRKEVP